MMRIKVLVEEEKQVLVLFIMFSNTLVQFIGIPLGKTVWIVVDVINSLVLFYSRGQFKK